jgi:hypothetical protein
MGIDLTNETKTKVSLSNESKNSGMTWDSSDPETWDSMDESQWDAPKVTLQKETKSKISLSNEAKI